MSAKNVTHPDCGQTWPNRNSLSHCPVCHETFGNHTVADAHRVTEDGQRICLDPAGLTVSGYRPVLKGGVWVSGMPNRYRQNAR